MAFTLPADPSLRYLQEQAKDLLKAHRAGKPDACAPLRALRRFHAAADAEILAADVALHEMQFALAMAYGFPSWPAMKAFVEAAATPDEPAATTGGNRIVLDGVPKVGFHRRTCPFVGSAEALLEYLGHPEPFDYLMGVSGAAFRRTWNRDDGGNVDLSYFQPEPFRLLLRAVGWDYRILPVADREGRSSLP